MIWRAARSADMDNPGSESEIANHAYSASCCPLTSAFIGEPVRISPGDTVVTITPYCASSERTASDSPANANLLAQYGPRCGTATRPPIEEMFTIRPKPRRRIAGTDSYIKCSGPQKWVAIAFSKS